MSTAIISPAIYVLDQPKSTWSAEQQKGISTTFPFDLQSSGPDDYVARTYLQFLWLPNSLMPLTHLVPSLRRVDMPSTSSSTVSHPMHALLEPLLLTTRSVTKKYHSELVQILINGGGEGEMEEAMMWYAVEHERPLEVDNLLTCPSPHKHGHDEDGLWNDEKWRGHYLERMERREVQIQILLYMFKLCLPGTPSLPPSLDLNNPSKMRRPGKRPPIPTPTEPILTLEEQLEAFMDKLAMWQLVGLVGDSLNPDPAPRNRNARDERDWTQIFVEDVVEPQFNVQLPEVCKLLRTKVFPTSPFSEDSDATPTHKVSPGATVAPRSPTTTNLTLKKSISRTSSFSLAPSFSRYNPSPTHPTAASLLTRSRSNTLSMSLAQEQEERSAAAAAAAEEQTRKRGRIHREVSMARVFKNKGKTKSRGLGVLGMKDPAVKIGALNIEKPRESKGITLVDETPVKQRTVSAKNAVIEPISFGGEGENDVGVRMTTGEVDEEEWMLDSSPAVVVFDPLAERRKENVSAVQEDGGHGSGEEWDETRAPDRRASTNSAMQLTPTRSKPPRKKPRKR